MTGAGNAGSTGSGSSVMTVISGGDVMNKGE